MTQGMNPTVISTNSITHEINHMDTINDAYDYIEMDWLAASGAGANDGHFELLYGGVSKETISSIDNDTHTLNRVQLGRVWASAGITGTIYFDDYASNDDGSVIGAVAGEAYIPKVIIIMQSAIRKGQRFFKRNGIYVPEDKLFKPRLAMARS